jgi:hypothetical protein
VDFANPEGNPAPDNTSTYRGQPSPVPMAQTSANRRGVFEISANYDLGWFGNGDWLNYTRTFPQARYRAYAGISSGGGGNMRWSLSRVISGQGTASQGLEPLGVFQAPASGGWGANALVPLTLSGERTGLNLQGETTLRASFEETSNFDFLLLESADADRAKVVRGPFSTSQTAWQRQEIRIEVAQAGRHLLTFRALNSSGGDNSVALDDIRLRRFVRVPARWCPANGACCSQTLSRLRPSPT